MENLSKNITWEDVKNDPNAVKVLDHGFIVLKETMGSDQTIAESARVSYGNGTKNISDDRNLIRYLVRHNHTTPCEMIEARFLIKIPIFLWRQMIRHRTANVNELSGRYSILPDEYYIPDELKLQSPNNKQGSSDDWWADMKYEEYWDKEYKAVIEKSRNLYEESIRKGMSREDARIMLPVSQYTMAYWKCDGHNIAHFLKLRLDSHAQYQIRLYAQAMYDLLKSKFPIFFEAIEDYKFKSKSFSRMELLALQDLLKSGTYNSDPNFYGMSKREIDEFKNKLNLK